MALLRITNGFADLADANLIVFASGLVHNMTDNPDFPNPDPSLADVTKAIDAFSNARIKAVDGGIASTLEKARLKQELVETLYLLAYYVLYASRGDRNKVLSTGFELAKERSTMMVIDVPGNLRLSDGGNPGMVALRFDRVIGAKSYLYQYATEEKMAVDQWTDESGTTCRHMFKKLPSGTKLYFRVVAIGVQGQRLASVAVNRYVQ